MTSVIGETIQGKSICMKFRLIFCNPEKRYVPAMIKRAMLSAELRPARSSLSQENSASVARRNP